ncbi:MAG: hydroxymethylbilane synthase [Acidimicrobiales bacterium]
MSAASGARVVRLATRGSPLALAQAGIVANLLEARDPRVRAEPVVVRTEGDRRFDEDLERIGGQGVFVKEVQAAVLDGRADVAVHSAKDLPPLTPDGLVLAAVPPRADPRDVLVGASLDGLAPGALVATSSARRRAQLADLRPDLGFVGLRGNMARRLERVEDGTVVAVVAAAAALDRLGWQDRIAQRLSPTQCLPQVGQGAIALECRSGDERCRALLGQIDTPEDHRALEAERAFLQALGAGCTLPAGALARPAPGGDRGLELEGMLATGDGRVVVRATLPGDDPQALGRALAQHLVHGCGASSLPEWAEA